jgi:hypothetical protein
MSKVKDKDLLDYSENQLRDIFTKAGLSNQDINNAISDYARYRKSEISSISTLSYNEIKTLGAEPFINKLKNLRQGGEIVKDILRKYFRYINYKKEIAESYQNSKSWGVVFTNCTLSDVDESQEAFVDYVEEIEKTQIKDVKHFQKLTGITHLNSWDNKTQKYINPDTEEESKDNAIKELEKTLINSRYSKYSRALDKALLYDGAKYKDLLLIKPHDYGLPKTWKGLLASDQYTAILYAISFNYLINEPAGLMLLPDLRSIAEEIEAPYSVVMDCFKLFNK